MLLALSLTDFVIVDRLNLNFDNGFTVLTGETGAGKSITLDAVGLLLGGKADYGQIRSGAGEARLSALFDISALPELQEMLRAQGLLEEGSEELNIRRTIDTKGKSRSFINAQAVTLAQLKTVGSALIDIHGQNAHHSLNQESERRRLLDAFAGALQQAETVRNRYEHWNSARKALQEAQAQAGSAAVERERLEWQFGEISRLEPHNGEWEALSRSHDTLSHAAELAQAAQTVGSIISGDSGLQHQVFKCQKLLSALQDIEPGFAESLEMLASIEAELAEIASNMRDAAHRADTDPAQLAEQERRMGELMGMARKYRIEPQDLPAKLEEISAGLAKLEEAADLEALSAAVSDAEAAYHDAAAHLSQLRAQAAERLSGETAAYMQHLAMKGARFAIELQASEAGAHGLEHIRFLVSANPGSPLRPLEKVASGGELARISLAIQVVTTRYTRVPTLIFDEVDTGIGGAVAETVGKALRTLGATRQVLAITHLPQVAACGDNHWQVYKHSDGSSTLSSITRLEGSGRTEEIARMLGGETITSTTRSHAAELLAAAGSR